MEEIKLYWANACKGNSFQEVDNMKDKIYIIDSMGSGLIADKLIHHEALKGKEIIILNNKDDFNVSKDSIDDSQVMDLIHNIIKDADTRYIPDLSFEKQLIKEESKKSWKSKSGKIIRK